MAHRHRPIQVVDLHGCWGKNLAGTLVMLGGEKVRAESAGCLSVSQLSAHKSVQQECVKSSQVPSGRSGGAMPGDRAVCLRRGAVIQRR